MPSYEDLLNADLSYLKTAVDDWQNLPKKISGADGVSQGFENNVMKDLEGSDWHGEAAGAAHAVSLKIRTQLRTAGDEANDVYNLLNDALGKFTDAQNRLKTIDNQVSDPHSSVRFDSDHNVVLKDPQDAEKDPAAARYMYEAVNEFNDSIKKILKDATDADEALYWALNQDPNGSDQGFNEDAYHSIADAEQARQNAIQDADQAVKLAQLGPKLTSDQLAQLNQLLSEHTGDPVFGAEFATKLGAANTLNFWAKLTDPSDNPALSNETDDLKHLQGNLSLTLADATRYDSSSMRDWENQIVQLGSQPIDSSTTSHPLGFQVMSNLMRFGNYDSSFLQRYGDALSKEDQKFKIDPSNHNGTTWLDVQNNSTLNFFGSDQSDPMNGFMEALGHNPEAATEFLKSDDHFKYLTQERFWAADTMGTDHVSGYADLGHALVAATLGRPYDLPDDIMHKTTDGAHIANEIVALYANNPHLLKQQRGIGDSLGAIAGGYIGDIDIALQDGHYANLFSNSQSPQMLHIGRLDTIHFLSTLGQDPDAYAAVSHAQRAFTLNALTANPPTALDPKLPNDDNAAPIVRTGAYVQGLIDKSRIDQAKSYGAASDAAYNNALADKKNWVKMAVNGIYDAGAAFIPGPSEDAKDVVKTIVPSLISTGHGAAKTEIGKVIDSYPGFNPKDTSQLVHNYTGQIAYSGQESTMAPYQDLVNSVPGLDTDGQTKLRSDLDSAAGDGYGRGAGDQDLMGQLPQSGVQQ